MVPISDFSSSAPTYSSEKKAQIGFLWSVSLPANSVHRYWMTLSCDFFLLSWLIAVTSAMFLQLCWPWARIVDMTIHYPLCACRPNGFENLLVLANENPYRQNKRYNPVCEHQSDWWASSWSSNEQRANENACNCKLSWTIKWMGDLYRSVDATSRVTTEPSITHCESIFSNFCVRPSVFWQRSDTGYSYFPHSVSVSNVDPSN